jgi:hypothetical protein
MVLLVMGDSIWCRSFHRYQVDRLPWTLTNSLYSRSTFNHHCLTRWKVWHSGWTVWCCMVGSTWEPTRYWLGRWLYKIVGYNAECEYYACRATILENQSDEGRFMIVHRIFPFEHGKSIRKKFFPSTGRTFRKLHLHRRHGTALSN